MEHCILYKYIFLAVVVFLAIMRSRGKVRDCLAGLFMKVLKICLSLVASVSSVNTEWYMLMCFSLAGQLPLVSSL